MELLAIVRKNVDRTIFHYNLQNFRMCTIVIEALTPFNRASRIEIYKISLDPGSFVEKLKNLSKPHNSMIWLTYKTAEC